MARHKAKAEAEKQREIRQGLRDAEGNRIEQPKTDDEDEEGDEAVKNPRRAAAL
jgi:hypothetical protein